MKEQIGMRTTFSSITISKNFNFNTRSYSKRPLFLILVLIFLCFYAGAQPVLQKKDAIGTNSATTGNEYHLTHNLTAVSASNLYLIFAISVRNGTVNGTLTQGLETSNVTYDGDPMIFIGSDIVQNNARTYIFGLASPSTANASAVVSVTMNTNNLRIVLGAMTFSNVNQLNPYNTFATLSGTSNPTSLSLNVASPASSSVFSVIASEDETIPDPSGYPATDFWNLIGNDTQLGGAGRVQARSGDPTSVVWNLNNTTTNNKDWVISGVSINAVPNADLRVTKSVNIPKPYIGQIVTFTIPAGNNGPSSAPTVIVNDKLPSGYTVSGTPTTTQGTYNAGSGLWDIGTIASGASATLTINAVVLGAGTYTNTATVTSDNVVDGNSTNNSWSVSITICQAGPEAPVFKQ